MQHVCAPGTIVVDDGGCNDDAMVGRWCEQGVFFVTRTNTDALLDVEQQEPIRTALSCMMLLRYLLPRSRFGCSPARLVARQRMNLFTHCDLHARFDDPFGPPPDPGNAPQFSMAVG